MLYYCLGGGYGHLTRYLAFCHTYSIQPELITASSDFIEKVQLPAEIKIHVPEEKDIAGQASFSLWLEKLICDIRPPTFFVDAFPGGILGELCDFKALENVDCIYLARILQWQVYQKRISGKLPEFSKILRLEQLCPEHELYLKDCRCEKINIELIDPPVEKISDLPPGFWLIIHSDAGEELHQLWRFAEETAQMQNIKPYFVVVSPGKRPAYLPADALHLDIYPATSLFKSAERVFSAAGFNICRQMAGMRDKHYLLPFPRSLDDQFLRASRLKSKTAPVMQSSRGGSG